MLLTNDLEDIPDPGSWGCFPLDKTLGVRFCNEEVRIKAAQLFEYRCRVGNCERGPGRCFHSLKELGNHLWYDHWRQFCYTCLHGRSAFLCEQHVYTQQDLHRHNREGDEARLGGRRPVLPIPSHPQCEFCRERFYNADELLRHMYKRHHPCQLCKRQGRNNEFYANCRCLGMHYQDQHYVCAHRNCLRGGHRLIAFAEEEELQLHYLKEHPDVPYYASSKQGQFKLQVGHASYEQRGGATFSDGGKGRGRRSEDASTADEANVSVRFAWPPGATAADARPDGAQPPGEAGGGGAGGEWFTGASDSEDEYDRYPYREPVRDAGRTKATRKTGSVAKGESDGEDDADAGGAGGEDVDGADRTINEEDQVCLRHSQPPEGDRSEDPNAGHSKCAGAMLDYRLEAVGLERAVATAGPRCGSRSCLSALSAVLEAIQRIDAQQGNANSESDWRGALKAAVGRLSAGEVEGLERMRTHLEQASGHRGAGGFAPSEGSTCDWEPLERVLGLRPLFFLLLQGPVNPSTPSASTASQGRSQRESIGPKKAVGDDLEAPSDEELRWRRWKLAAQEAILALEPEARNRLHHYVTLSVSRREQLPLVGGAVDGEDAGALEEFPALRPRPRERKRSEDAAVPEAAADKPKWSELHQSKATSCAEYPALGDSGEAVADVSGWGRRCPAVALPKAAATAQSPAPSQSMDDPEAFPSLGGSTAPAALAAPPRWGAPTKKNVSKASSAAAAAAAPAAEPAAMTLEDWVGRKPQKEGPSSFQGIQEDAFPTLPMGSGPPKPAPKAKTIAAGKASKAKVASKVVVRPVAGKATAEAAWVEHRQQEQRRTEEQEAILPEPAPPPPKPSISEMTGSSSHFPELPGSGAVNKKTVAKTLSPQPPPEPEALRDKAAATSMEEFAPEAGKKKKGREKKVLLAFG